MKAFTTVRSLCLISLKTRIGNSEYIQVYVLCPFNNVPATEPIASTSDRLMSPNVALSRDRFEQAIRGNDRGAAAVLRREG